MHTVNGAYHLLPSEICDFCNYAMASNDVWLVEVFTLLLMSIDLFLCRSKYSSLHLDSFNTDLSLLTHQYLVKVLNVSVKGKRKATKDCRNKSEQYAR